MTCSFYKIVKYAIIAVLGVLVLGFRNLPEQEYILKAAFLERFTRFIEWPPDSSMDDTTKSFVIGVIGENQFGNALDNLASIQKIKNKKIEIRYCSNSEDILLCHLLFISSSEQDNIIKICSLIKNKPILTVCDSKDFFGHGIHILIFPSNEKLSFEIDETAIKNSGLKASYMLLMAGRKHK